MLILSLHVPVERKIILVPVSQFVRSVNTYYWIRLRLTPAGEGDGYEIVMTVNTELDHHLQLNLLPGK